MTRWGRAVASKSVRKARAYVSLGSNLGDRAASLGEARARLMAADGVRLIGLSAVRETAPVDVLDQPDFLNQVVALDTTLAPRALLERCLAIELEMGRDRAGGPRRGPRAIDLDILVYGGREIVEDGLVIPHPRLAERSFFLELCRQAGTPVEWLPAATAR